MHIPHIHLILIAILLAAIGGITVVATRPAPLEDGTLPDGSLDEQNQHEDEATPTPTTTDAPQSPTIAPAPVPSASKTADVKEPDSVQSPAQETKEGS